MKLENKNLNNYVRSERSSLVSRVACVMSMLAPLAPHRCTRLQHACIDLDPLFHNPALFDAAAQCTHHCILSSLHPHPWPPSTSTRCCSPPPPKLGSPSCRSSLEASCARGESLLCVLPKAAGKQLEPGCTRNRRRNHTHRCPDVAFSQRRQLCFLWGRRNDERFCGGGHVSSRPPNAAALSAHVSISGHASLAAKAHRFGGVAGTSQNVPAV